MDNARVIVTADVVQARKLYEDNDPRDETGLICATSSGDPPKWRALPVLTDYFDEVGAGKKGGGNKGSDTELPARYTGTLCLPAPEALV